MSFQAGIRVRYDEFADAASRLPGMRRGPAGARGEIPADTLLSPDRDGVSVETPAVASLVRANQPWTVQASVDARKLRALCATLKKLGAKGNDIEIGLNGRQFWLRFRTTTLSLPTIWVKPS